MPTYSYRCTECDHAFDIQQAFTDDSLTECPNCGGLLRKVFGNIGVSFSGSGFYRTDSRAADKAPSKGDSAGAGEKAAKSEKAPKAEKAASAPATSSGSSGSSGSSSSSVGGTGSKPAAS